MSSNRKKLFLPLIVVAVAVAAALLLASAREAPPRRPRQAEAPLVETAEVRAEEVAVVVRGQGTVVPRTEIQLVPQVSGRVERIHRELAAGGRFAAGEALVVIDPVDFELRVQGAAAEVARAEVRLETEQAEAAVARDEWYRLHPAEQPSPLVVRQPQVRQAEAELAAARASLAEARLSLERTRIAAPFNGRVVSESVDAGQYVLAGQPLATIHATDVLEVPVPLEDRELAWFDIGSRGAPAEISVQFAGGRHTWQGIVARSQGVDSRSRMVTVVVEVRDDFDPAGERPQLLPGMFVDAAIKGRTLRAAMTVPRHALHGDRVWVVEDGTLAIREVEVARTSRDEAFITRGLEAGDRVVTTSLEAVTDGMAVRLGGEPEEGRTSRDLRPEEAAGHRQDLGRDTGGAA
jgi:RND family efflux transporter MFP subunit